MRRRHMRSTRSARQLHSLSVRPALILASLMVLAITLALVLVTTSQVRLAVFTHHQAAAGTHRASAQSRNSPAELAVGRAASGGGLVGYWVDSVNSTTYTTDYVADPQFPATFDFTVPGASGGEIVGELPLILLPDGSYAEGTPGEVNDTYFGNSDSFPLCDGGTLASDNTQGIQYRFYAHFSADRLAAYATLSYVLASDKGSYAAFCHNNATQGPGITTYQLSAGCAPTTCLDLTSQIGPSVAAYDMDVETANWADAYMRASEQITKQYSSDEFVSLLTQQTQSTGKIMSISPPLTTPVVQFTPEYQAYFAAQQTVTVDNKGAMSTQTLTNYYLLENGSWLFWFSA